MISMTTYWQQFKECIDKLPADNTKQPNLIATAQKMIEIGLTIETLGITEIKQVVDNLRKVSELFAYKVFIDAPDKAYTFYLPKIIDNESLIFAKMYYQHLINYEQVNYEGSIYWFRQKVIDSVNEKKISTRIQAQALLAEINAYCTKEQIAINEPELLRREEEPVQDYISRVTRQCTNNSAPVNESEENEHAELNMSPEELLEILTSQRGQVKTKLDDFSNKLALFLQAQKKHKELKEIWQNKWLITRVFYWLISFFYQPDSVKNLKIAFEQANSAEKELNQLLTPEQTVESYSEELRQQLEEIQNSTLKTQEEIRLIHEGIIIRPVIDKPETRSEPRPERMQPVANTQKNNYSDQLNYCYGFFKEHLPSRYYLQAAAVGLAAIAIQNI